MTSEPGPAATVAELVVRRAVDDRPGLVFQERTWSWREVVTEAAGRAAYLDAALDRDRPRHVGVLMGNTPEYVFLLLGAALCGATVVGVNETRRGAEVLRDIEHTDCQLVLTDAAHQELLAGLPLPRVQSCDQAGWLQLLPAAALPEELPLPDALWVLIFTSGSTAAPKAVRRSQGSFAGGARAMGFAPHDVLYSAMPLAHGNALASNLVPGLAAGATIALRERFSASQVLPDVRRFGATFFNSVGRALGYVLATPPTPHDTDHALRFVLAPEASPRDTEEFRERFGVPVLSGYGSSEGAIILLASGKPGALGKAPRGMDVAVVDPQTAQECPLARFDEAGLLVNAQEATGEIVRRDSAGTFEGYYNNDEATAERTRSGWFWSGDLGYRDADGIFYFAGRAGDWLRVDSENFAAAPIERILARHPDVAAAAVYAVPDPRTGDQVMAALQLRDGARFDAAGFDVWLGEQGDLGTKWRPRFVRIVDPMPVTGNEKVDKRPLRRAAWRTADPLWWRTDPRAGLALFRPQDAAELEAELASHGRARLVP